MTDTTTQPHASTTDFFKSAWEMVADAVHRSAVDHGFWEFPNVSEKLALIHGEVSECLEACRMEGWRTNPSEHITSFSAVTEELADIVIRTMDLAAHLQVDLAGAILAKVRFNATRPYKHNKRF